MEITPHVEAIREALAAVAGEDEASVAVADRLVEAVAPAVQLQLLDLLGQVALEVSSQLPDGRLDLQLAGRDAVLVYTDTGSPPSAASTPDDDTATARLTLRMSDSMKSAVERAAEAAGQSTNAWLVAAARQCLDTRPARRRSGGIGNRLSGYSQT
jgi:hypothetical protein